MKNFVFLFVIFLVIPVVYFMGFKGLSLDEMLQELKLKKDEN